MNWIHQTADWPAFSWNSEVLSQKLADVRHRQGRLLERMESLGFDLRTEASLNTLTVEVVQSSAIEGETLNSEALRDIRNLLTQGLLIQNFGGGRSTSYRLPDLEELKALNAEIK